MVLLPLTHGRGGSSALGLGPSGQTNRFQDGLSGAVEVPGLALHLGRLFNVEPHKRSSATRLHSIR